MLLMMKFLVLLRITTEDELDMYFFMNLSILKTIVELVGQCPECKQRLLSVMINPENKKGFSQEIVLECACTWTYSSPRITSNRRAFDINRRIIMAFREMGAGLSSIETFCRMMNMTTPMTNLSYAEQIHELHPLYKEAAENSMFSAAAAIKEKTGISDDSPTDIVASFDGSWQRRGYSSLNGVVTCIERVNDKCIDVEIKSKDCKSCTFWKKQKKSPAYEAWKADHKCSMNHTGSASAMETVGTIDIFKRSVQKHNLCYTTFIGDGDSSSYPAVVEENPYQGKEVKKGECVGHVQKRVGSNLIRLRKSLPKERKKCIFGTGKLTTAGINYIQNCYGLAIRQNTGNLYQMKKNVGAILHHVSDIKPDEARHKWCPRTEDSWCTHWNQSKKQSNNLNLPPNIIEEPEIKQIFDRLRDDKLLSKCLHGKTQNVNESLNGIIWTRCPKRVYVTRKTLEIGVYSAVLEFNDGKRGIEKAMIIAGLNIGTFQSALSEKVVRRHKRTIQQKSSEKGKRRRKDLRAIKKKWTDKNEEQEGKMYEAGSF